MNAALIAAFGVRVQATLEACNAGTLVIGADSFACARGAWRNAARRDDRTLELVEVRQVGVRVRKALLTAESVTVTPMTTSCTLDGVAALVVGVDSGPNDDSFHLTLEAAAVAGAQQ